MKITRLFSILLIMCLGLIVSACGDVATPQGACAVIAGTGEDGNDAKVKDFVYPGETYTTGSDATAKYFPCGPRTYAVGSTKKNTSGQVTGDRIEPATGRTKEGTPVNVALTAYWTVNQQRPALMSFTELGFKYEFFSDEPRGGGNNFATEGWTGMLGENMGPAVDDTVRAVMPEFDDGIWSNNDVKQWEKLGTRLSEEFNAYARKRTGYNDDLFCGSGNSAWKNPDKPGADSNPFECTQVRFAIDNVTNANPEEQKQVTQKSAAERSKEANAAQLDAAKAKYGDDAGFWLGVQDSIAKCQSAKVPCTMNVGRPPSR